jgi:PTH1 family peptidyl-tRNA hydrolase
MKRLGRLLHLPPHLSHSAKDEADPSGEDSAPFLIVGLGNPGRQYKENRHNIGFMMVDRLAARLGLTFSRLESRALVTNGEHQGKRVILAKPQTYMNLSGEAVSSLQRFYKVPLEHLLVAYDDVDLPLGTLRLRPSGGGGGQKGILSVIERLGTQDFPRLRLGIDQPPGRMDASAYVLQDFTRAQVEYLPEILDRAVDAALTFIEHGLPAAMNRFNGPLEVSP